MLSKFKTQHHMTLKEKREMAMDLKSGMSYVDAAKKYNSSAGAVARVKKQINELIAIDQEKIHDSRKRTGKVKTEGLDKRSFLES